jgi:hypothetical protein
MAVIVTVPALIVEGVGVIEYSTSLAVTVVPLPAAWLEAGELELEELPHAARRSAAPSGAARKTRLMLRYTRDGAGRLSPS